MPLCEATQTQLGSNATITTIYNNQTMNIGYIYTQLRLLGVILCLETEHVPYLITK